MVLDKGGSTIFIWMSYFADYQILVLVLVAIWTTFTKVLLPTYADDIVLLAPSPSAL